MQTTIIPRSATLQAARRIVLPMILLAAVMALIAATTGPAWLNGNLARNSQSEMSITFSDDCQTFTVTSSKELSYVRWTTDQPVQYNPQGHMVGNYTEETDFDNPHLFTETVEVAEGETLTVQAKSGNTIIEESCTRGGTTDPCEEDPTLPECQTDPCEEDPTLPECETDPCEEDPTLPECTDGPFAEAELLNLGPLNDVDDIVSDGANTDEEGDEGLLNSILGPDFVFPPAECPIPIAARCGLLWETDDNEGFATTGVLMIDDENYGLHVITSDCDDAKLVEGHFMGTGGNLWDQLNGGSGGQLGDALNALSIQIQQNGNVLVVDLGGTANDPDDDGPLGELVVGHASCTD